MPLCSVGEAPVGGAPDDDGLVIGLARDEGADGVPGDPFDEAGVAPQDSRAYPVGHVPYMDRVIQAAAGQRQVIWRPIEIYLLQPWKAILS